MEPNCSKKILEGRIKHNILPQGLGERALLADLGDVMLSLCLEVWVETLLSHCFKLLIEQV